MAMWRVLKPLSKGHDKVVPAGSIVALEWLDEDGLNRLQQVGAISRLTAPPLHKLPGWKLRSKRLRAVNVNTVEHFLEMGDKEMAELIEADPRTVAKWRDELLGKWLSFPPTHKRRCCGG